MSLNEMILKSFKPSIIISSLNSTHQNKSQNTKSLSSEKKLMLENKIFKLPKISILISTPTLSNKISKEKKTLNNIFNTDLTVNLISETSNCDKYHGSKKKQTFNSFCEKKMIKNLSKYKAQSVIPYKVKENLKLQCRNNLPDFFTRIITKKKANKESNYQYTDTLTEYKNISSNDVSVNSLKNIKGSTNLIDDLINKIKNENNSEQNFHKKKFENKDYYEKSMYVHMKSKSPKSQFSCSVSFPYLMKDNEYLNNLSKENNVKYKKNFK